MPLSRSLTPVFAALLAGIISGLLLTAVQQVEVAPLIRQAEALETHAHGGAPALLFTLSANVVLATGFALLLGAAISLRPRAGWRAGLLWGAAGYVVFFVAPALGLPPELPGTEFSPVRERQMWWIGTAAMSAAGLWLLVFGNRPWLRVAGVAFLVAPHLIGAPQLDGRGGTPTAEMTRDFIRATYIVNAVLWLTIGGLLGVFYRGKSSAITVPKTR